MQYMKYCSITTLIILFISCVKTSTDKKCSFEIYKNIQFTPDTNVQIIDKNEVLKPWSWFIFHEDEFSIPYIKSNFITVDSVYYKFHIYPGKSYYNNNQDMENLLNLGISKLSSAYPYIVITESFSTENSYCFSWLLLRNENSILQGSLYALKIGNDSILQCIREKRIMNRYQPISPLSDIKNQVTYIEE